MVLLRPVTKTIISTTEFGQPVYDWIMANSPSAWQTLTMQNGWTPYAVGSYPPCSFRRLGNMLQLRGMTSGGVPGNVPCATLPAGFRPLYTYEVLTYQYNGQINFAQLAVYVDGKITLNNQGANIGTASLYCQIPLD